MMVFSCFSCVAQSSRHASIPTCSKTFGFSEFQNGDVWVKIRLEHDQVYLMDNSEPRVDSRATMDKYPVCIKPRLIVEITPETSTTKKSWLQQRLKKNWHGALNFYPLFAMSDSEFWLISINAQLPAKKLIYPLFMDVLSLEGVKQVQPDIALHTRLTMPRNHKARYDLKHYSLVDDIGVRPLWRHTQGQGVRVAIIDKGFTLKHRDFVGLASIVYQNDEDLLQPTPHGMQVASIIFAQHNHVDINGIAPQAYLIAVSLTKGFTSNLMRSIALAMQEDPDIINLSWYLPYVMHPLKQTIKHIAQTGRQGERYLVDGRSRQSSFENESSKVDSGHE